MGNFGVKIEPFVSCQAEGAVFTVFGVGRSGKWIEGWICFGVIRAELKREGLKLLAWKPAPRNFYGCIVGTKLEKFIAVETIKKA